MDCKDVQGHLSNFEASDMAGAPAIGEHLGSCAECRARAAQFTELREALGSLSEQTVELPLWLQSTITETVTQKAARIAALRRFEKQARKPEVWTGGALLAAGIAGAFIFRSKRRRRPARQRLRLRQVFAQA